jgi:16S rRNA (guanine527-N7)-methyltransferase
VSDARSVEAALAVYRTELVRWGERMNLVGSTEPAAIARHFEDSLHGAPALPAGARVADLGSGAGFPGLPIAIARPDLHVTLVEIREKRVAFLRHVVRALGLAIEVVQTKLEAAPADGFDVALLRAVAPPEESAQIGRAWVRPEGQIWIWAGPRAELPDAEPIPLPSGGAILRIHAAAISRGTP